MAFTTTFTAPLAIIKTGGVPIGKMKNIRLTENYRRGSVTGIGRLTKSEVPLLEAECSLSCSFYLIDFSVETIKGLLLRTTGTLDAFVDTVLLNDQGVQIDIMRKVKGTTLPNGVITSSLQVFATIQDAFLTREGMDITENAISGRDIDIEYLTPVIQ